MIKIPRRLQGGAWFHALMMQRSTTMPEQAQPGQIQRAPAGPPIDGLQRLQRFLEGAGSMGLFLITYLIDGQRFQDATAWFDGAACYVERVATLMHDLPLLLPAHADMIERLPFTGADLETRLHRVRLLEEVATQIEGLHKRARNTLLVERGDLMRLADTAMTEVERMQGLPSLDQKTRQTLSELAKIPLNTWRKWQDRVQQTKKKNAQLRSSGAGSAE